MCLNRQCQNVSVFGVHECSAKCSGRGVSTAPFFPSYFSVVKTCCDNPSPHRSVVYFWSHSSIAQKLILAAVCSKYPVYQWVGSCYNALQSIILDAERFNQLDIMASFMLSFKCHSSYSQAVVLVLKTVLKSEGQALFDQIAWSGDTQFDFEPGSMDIGFFLHATHQTSMGGPVWDEKCGFVVLPLNSLVGPRGFACDWFKFVLHQSDRGNSFYCLLKWNISSYYTVIFVCLVPIKTYL